MKKLKLFQVVFLSVFCVASAIAQYTTADSQKAGWRLCIQAWDFNKFTFAETVDKIKAAGVNNIEMFPGQTIGGGIEGKTAFTMNKETRDKILALVHSKGLKIVNYGVVNAKDQNEWIQLFEFAKAMGIETIITEADSLQLNYIEPLCEKYQVNIALHNHPDPKVFGQASIYWNPDYTIGQIAKRNKYIGVCADLGHWLRSGLNPLESLKKYNGRVLDVHAKDLVPGENTYCGFHDVPWGTGLSNFSGLIHELKHQGYKGYITIEYEYNWDNSLPEIKESVEYFNRLVYWMNKE